MYAGRVMIKFDESRTTIREDTAGKIDVRITGQTTSTSAISMTVRAITFGEFTGPLPSEFPSESLPDPAEGTKVQSSFY